MLWSMEKLSELKVVTTWQNQAENSGATRVDTNGKNNMEREDLISVPNAETQTSTEPLKIGDMPELDGVADTCSSSEDGLDDKS